MANAPRDDNFIPTLLGASSTDGKTPTSVYVDPATHRLLVNATSGVVGPGSSTDKAIARWNGTTGETIQNSAVTLSDGGNLAGVGTVSASSWIAPFVILNGATTATLTVATLTANRSYALPNQSGTIATLTDITIVNAESNSSITPVADGTYTVGDKITPVTGTVGTITVKDGIIIAVQQAQ